MLLLATASLLVASATKAHDWPQGCELTCTSGVDCQPSFPGAEGSGAVSVGGRCGKVVVVRDPADYDPVAGPVIENTLRWALEEVSDQPRLIVFNFDPAKLLLPHHPIIKLVAPLEIESGDSHLTIAGETAPGGGIAIAEYGFKIRDAHDIIFRHLRLRNVQSFGEQPCESGEEDPPPDSVVTATGDGIDIALAQRVMIDHVSVAWATDEGIGAELSELGDTEDVTVQNSYIAETLWSGDHPCVFPHSRGLVYSDGNFDASLHHNFLVSSNKRNPRVSGGAELGSPVSGQQADVRYNLTYNWGDKVITPEGYALQLDLGIYANFGGNWLREGPATDPDPQVAAGEPIWMRETQFNDTRAWLDCNCWVDRDPVTKADCSARSSRAATVARGWTTRHDSRKIS